MRGRSIPLSRSRRLVCDLLYFSQGIPTIPVQRRMNLQPLIEARKAQTSRPSWTAIFCRAFALVAAEFPELRRAYIKFPWPHLYEYPHSVAGITIERELDGDRAVMVAKLGRPEEQSLAALTQSLRHAAEAPVLEVKDFRRSLRLGRLPLPLRRLAWWLGLNLARQRPRYFGTFWISVYSALGAESLHPLTPVTITLNYGVFSPEGNIDVRLIYDHRVTDGAIIARALARLEEMLLGQIVEELRKGA
jgi:hypothetical protein